jgi:hypothetical protein
VEQHEIFRVVTPRAVMVRLLQGQIPRLVDEGSTTSQFKIVPRRAAREQIQIGTDDNMVPLADIGAAEYRLFEQREYSVQITTGLRVSLQEGDDSQIVFAQGDRRIAVSFNPQLRSADMLSMQKPDILISLREPHWPTLELVIDAKYRVDADADGERSPPPTTIDALHRYRDAILEARFDNEAEDDARPSDNRAMIIDAGDGRSHRSVVHSIALFPARVEPTAYRAHRLWRSIERIGIGAIPLLPGQTELLRDWLVAGRSRATPRCDRELPRGTHRGGQARVDRGPAR